MLTLVPRPFRPIPERLKFQPTPVLYLMAQLNLVRKMMLIPILILKTYPMVLMFIMILVKTPILVSKKFMLMKTHLLMIAFFLLEMLMVKLDLHISVPQKFMLVVKPVLFSLRKLICFQTEAIEDGSKQKVGGDQ